MTPEIIRESSATLYSNRQNVQGVIQGFVDSASLLYQGTKWLLTGVWWVVNSEWAGEYQKWPRRLIWSAAGWTGGAYLGKGTGFVRGGGGRSGEVLFGVLGSLLALGCALFTEKCEEVRSLRNRLRL